jgi:hypothetical protein
MKCTITITDNPTTGEVDIEGEVDAPEEGQLPTGAHIMYAYINAHMGEIVQAAQVWFREGIVRRVADSKGIDLDE